MTPRAPKLRALLVLIATGPQMTRPRAFLQDMLWGSAAPERGAASLRQALTSLRHALGEDAGVLRADGNAVGFDAKRLRIDLRPPASLDGAPEFADGLDVAEPEFEDWLRDRRQEFGRLVQTAPARMPAPAPLSDRATLVTLMPSCADPALRSATEILTADIAAQVARYGNAAIQLDPRGDGPRDRLALQVRSASFGPHVKYQVSLIELATQTVIWTGDCNSAPESPLTQPDLFLEITSNAAFEAVRHFGRIGADLELRPDRLAYQMYAHLPFRASHDLGDLEAWLAADHGPECRAVQLAWRARLRVVAMLERTGDRQAAAEEARCFTREALQLAPGNAMVTALASDVVLQLDNQPEVAGILAQTGVELDPGNPFVSAIYAQALVRCGKTEQGLAMALRAQRLSVGQPNRSWWNAIIVGAAMQVGNVELARKHAEIAHFQAPDFRPPLRFLSGLRFQAGDEAGAARALQDLKALEPDFSLERMADGSYPVASMRNTPLMAVTQSGLL